mmetsp:Transcript_131815/g.294961  ORF Transcript_131815/g.294961 Transcript_131815/m.294961 type:complete len:235 (-) Transcript_131815:135-839(-)
MALTVKTVCLAAVLVSASALQISTVNADACTCLDWKDAYSNYGYSCEEMGFEFCSGFFMRMSGNLCVNQGIGAGDLATEYCFVSSACQQLNGGKQESAQIAKKFCTEADDRLVDKTPTEIDALCAKDDLDRGLVVKMAYVTPGQTRWDSAKTYFTTGSTNLAAKQIGELAAVQESGSRTVIDSRDGHPPFAVVDGSKVYEVKMNMGYAIGQKILGRSLFEHPRRLNTMTCVSGC